MPKHTTLNDFFREITIITEKISRFFNESDLFKSLGFYITELNETSVTLEISGNNPCHRGGFGFLEETGINGAVISAALESAVGICGFSAFGGRPAGVIELSVKMLRVIRKKPCRVEAVIDRKIIIWLSYRQGLTAPAVVFAPKKPASFLTSGNQKRLKTVQISEGEFKLTQRKHTHDSRNPVYSK